MRIRRKYLFYVIIFSSAIIQSVNSGVDATVSKLYISNPFALGLATFIVGIPISLILIGFFSIKIRKKSIGARLADPTFKKIRLIRKKEVKFQFLAAIGNAVYTLGYFMLFKILGDPSIVIPFTQVVILYLVAIESISEKDMPTLSEFESIIIVTFGAILGSLSLSGNLNLESITVVFLVINPGWVLFAIYQRKLKWLKIDGQYNDSINIRFWNVVFSAVITVLIIFFYDVVMGTNNLFLGLFESVQNFFWVGIVATGAFFSFILYIRALGMGKASVAQAVKSSTIVFSIPVTLAIASFGIIEPFSLDPTLLLIKAIGIIIMLLGISSFALNLVKAYIFIKVKPGVNIEGLMDDIWKLKGVTHVTATAGRYDLVVKIRIRTLVKGYEKIIRKLDDLKAIQSYKWDSVLKEWDNL
ncbi:MAG: Lrp/AsnC ligand binding domain-containing protein [Candidatus Thermoplasmatota archaeon]